MSTKNQIMSIMQKLHNAGSNYVDRLNLTAVYVFNNKTTYAESNQIINNAINELITENKLISDKKGNTVYYKISQ